MAIQRYKPLSLLDELQRDVSTLFNTPALATNFDSEEWSPAVDIKETKNDFVIHADLPGVKSEDIEVTAENGVLTIKGQRESEKKEEKDNYKRIERFSGSFMRRFTLPTTADLDHISAKTKNGVLELHVPKTEKSQSKRIEIKTEK
ncbi:MAG: Hsp20/alpha crystallin family protein [Pseudomonadota bacterium]|nr:Hsp20/alpha crystallin family protein [Pseudomonadota bacterium]MDO7710977.1 Hsp20/alpha crystallin family protein [Pseudomonadota bacterium]